MIQRRPLVARLLADRGKDLLVVAGLGAPANDCTAAGDHPLTFPLWGAMGSAVMMGLGLALSQPQKRVLVITGDGEVLMGLGSLATAAVMAPQNLAVAVLDNERFGETGNQETHTARGTDLAKIAEGSGFRSARTVREERDIADATKLLRTAPGPVFVSFKVAVENLPMTLPPRDASLLKHRFREALLGKPD